MNLNRARTLRKNLTKAEQALWKHLRLRQLGGYKFRRQQPIGQYIVDFACFEAKLIIELDGGHHSQQAADDAERSGWLEAQGFRVLRFWNNQVLEEIEAVKQVITEALEGEVGAPHLDPPPQGGRRPLIPSPLVGEELALSLPKGQDGGYETRTPSLTLPRQGGEKTSSPSMGEGWDGGDTLLRHQGGFILPWAIMVILLGVFIVVPVISLAGKAFRGHSVLEDQVRSFYAADAIVHAFMSDMVRGADAVPLPPNTYTAPTIDFGDIVPSVSIQVFESKTLATVKPVDYLVAGNPTVLVGFSPIGTGLDLAEDDDSYYKLSDAGTPPSLSYEVTSEAIGFPTISFGEVRIVALSTKSYTKVEVFVYNPDDPLHTLGGYNPIADVTEILDLATTEETISVFLEDADVAYLNSLPTKTLKIKIKATRTGGFRLDTDRVAFAMAGVVTTDERSVLGKPAISTGTLVSGSGSNLASDDVSYYQVSSSGAVIQFEVNSDSFVFSALDTVSTPYIARSSKDGVVVELYVYNPTDPAHTDSGYNPEPDLTATISLKNTDKAMTFSVSEEDVAYLNTLSPISMKLKIRATHTSDFQLESDMLAFIATSSSAPAVVTRQISEQYIDPGLKNPYMAQIASHEGYVLRIYNVHPGLLSVNWAAHAPDYRQAGKSVQVFRGLVISSGVVVPPGRTTSAVPAQGNDLLEAASSRPGEAFVRTSYIDVDSGLYTIVFYNDSSSTLITDPFAATGNPEDTWIYAPAYKDYLVDVQVGNVRLKAVVRQIPGPTEPPAFPWSTTNISWIENLVLIQSWEPYGVGP